MFKNTSSFIRFYQFMSRKNNPLTRLNDSSIKTYRDQKNDIIIHKEFLIGSRQFSNFVWAIILMFGGFGFVSTGLSSYFQRQILFVGNGESLDFIPQGILLLFYGTLALSLFIFVMYLIIEDIGSGFNEYDSVRRVVRVFRKGFSFLNNSLYLVYPFDVIDQIELEIINNIVPKRTIYLLLKDGRRIPLNPSTVLIDLSDIEKRAVFIANLLNVNLVLSRL